MLHAAGDISGLPVQVSEHSSGLSLWPRHSQRGWEHQPSILPVWRDSECGFANGEQQHG